MTSFILFFLDVGQPVVSYVEDLAALPMYPLAYRMLGTSAECGQNVVESVTPVCPAPATAQTALPLYLHLTLPLKVNDLTLLLLPQSWLWWPWHL